MGRERRGEEERREVTAVGLTGGIGAGKSTALALFGECGAQVFSADEVVHGLYGRPAVAARVGAHFGREVLAKDGSVDRSALAEAVRGRPNELHWLEKLTHPLVVAEIRRRIGGAPAGAVVVCEVPLLFEAGCEKLFDLVAAVEAGEEVRRRRSVHRFGLDQFTELEGLQASSEQRMRGSDFVFVNDGSLDDLREFVRHAYESARSLLREGRPEEGR
jgi:dephospho-CoA kinase